MQSLQGQFLIAAPQLSDSNFCRSVVLVMQHDQSGAFGLVVNQLSNLRVADLWKKVAQADKLECDEYVAVGGPVQGPVLVLHTAQQLGDTEVIPGVFVATDRQNIREVVFSHEKFRVFTGYSGWGAGQLENEFEIGGWLHLPASRELVFYENLLELWQHVMNLKGQSFLEDTLGIDWPLGDIDRN
jgi:putative transcriptional regulator